MEKVSVIVPLYNKVRYVKETIDSVRKQSYPDWELLVVDDGSTDGSYECVRDMLVPDDENIVLLRRADFSADKGASVCRNIGLDHAKGDFILFLDGDDILSPNALMNRINYTRKYPGYSFYVFNEAFFLDDPAKLYQRTTKRWFERLEYLLALNKKAFFLKKFLVYDLPWHTSSPFWRKHALTQVNGFRGEFQRLQDPELHTRILLEKDISFKVLRYTTPPDVFLRVNTSRMTSGNIAHFNDHVRCVKHFVQFFSRYLAGRGQQKKLRYLQGYLLSAEQTGNYYLQLEGDEEKRAFISLLDNLYKEDNVSPLVNERYRRFVHLLRTASTRRWAAKLKLPAVFIKGYKYFM